jgi:hypothetical protein
MWATELCRAELVMLLLAAGADKNVKNKVGLGFVLLISACVVYIVSSRSYTDIAFGYTGQQFGP